MSPSEPSPPHRSQPGQTLPVPGATVGVRVLRNQVSSLIRRAEQGERIIITVDGKPRAQLGPLAPGDGGPTLHDLAAAGLIEPPAAPPPARFPVPLSVPADVRLDRLIEQIRGR